MKLNLSNNELVAVLNAVQAYLELEDDNMIEASFMSFANKINNQITRFNPTTEELVLQLIRSLNEIKELKAEGDE